MKNPTFGPILVAIVLFCVLLCTPNSLLVSLISNQKVKQAAISLNPNMFQGIDLQQKMLENKKYFPIYGSSELSRLDAYHPSNYFKENPSGFTPFLIGRGGTQSLVQFLTLAATSQQLHNKKIAFILSPQWFTPQGLSEVHFAENFSKLQAYNFAFNTTLDPSLKKRAAQRLLQFQVVQKDITLKALLEGIVYSDIHHTLIAKAMAPLAYINQGILEHKDFITSTFNIHQGQIYTSSTDRPISWKEIQKQDEAIEALPWSQLLKKAETTGQQESRSNPFGIDDYYYKKLIAKKLPYLRGYKANQSYAQSPEYGDLQLILDLLKETHTKALFISIPVNGPWYDYAAFPKQKRTVYYQKVRKQIQTAGFPVADFSSHEYDKYFIKDTLHIGWKGWVYTDEALKIFI